MDEKDIIVPHLFLHPWLLLVKYRHMWGINIDELTSCRLPGSRSPILVASRKWKNAPIGAGFWRLDSGENSTQD